MEYRFGIGYIDVVIYHIDMVILDIDIGYGLMIWEMTVSIWSSPISIWDILSPCAGPHPLVPFAAPPDWYIRPSCVSSQTIKTLK